MALKLESKIFDVQARKEILSAVPYQAAVEFREDTRQKMENASVSGRTYSRRRSDGFRRYHQASARGERLAVDSGNLANSALKAERTGEFSARTFIDDDVAPYAAIEQENFNRQVITEDDEKQAQEKLNERAQNALDQLL